MSFNSLDFLIFFSLVTALFFLTPHRFRWMTLLAASYYFYMSWNPKYVLLIIFATLVNYFCGIQIARSATPSRKKGLLILGISATLSQLLFFKYYNFFTDSLRTVFDYFNLSPGLPALNLLLPVGISFFTFQSLGYIIDVYRGAKEPEKHLGIFALYVSFFPQLLAGPIGRSTQLLPQFYEKQDFNFSRAADGLRLILWGLFKKIVIADRLVLLTDQVFNNATDYTGLSLIIAIYFFAFQMYCDFSAYSDIAIGVARVMGYNLMINFNHPYLSGTVTEFWRRWHISLSTWLNDYLYTPLAIKYRDRGKAGIILALLVTFFLSGLWHGAGWTFVIFGVLHGWGVIWEALTKKTRKKFSQKMPAWLFNSLSMLVTFHFVCITWIFFRANSIADAFYILGHLFSGLGDSFDLGHDIGMGFAQFAFSVFLIILLETVHFIQRNGKAVLAFFESRAWFRWSLYYAMIISILVLGSFSHTAFIYIQF